MIGLARFNWQKIQQWIIENFQDKNEVEVDDLIWLDKKLGNQNKIFWNYVDTVDFDIESIPKKKELIIDFRVKPKIVREKWQLLNTEK